MPPPNNILDANIEAERASQLRRPLKVKQIGVRFLHSSADDEDIINLLKRLKTPTFITKDCKDFYKRQRLDKRYCIICQEFKNEGFSLSDRATVSVDDTGKWLIVDNRRRYSIRKGENELNICVDVSSRLTDIQMLDEKIGYAVGESNTVLKTTDGGKTWIAVMTGQR